jgi:hypothetical protein
VRSIMARGDYERLNHRERLILLVQAQARCDDNERQLLIATSPMKSYRAVDEGFDRPFKAIWQLVYFLSIQLNKQIGKIRMVDAMQPRTALLIRAAAMESVEKVLNDVLGADWRERPTEDEDSSIQKCSHAPDCVDRATEETLDLTNRTCEKLRERSAAEASAILVSFDRFTQQVLGLDGQMVLRAWMSPVADEVDELEIMQVEPFEEVVQLWGQVWARWWNKKMGNSQR